MHGVLNMDRLQEKPRKDQKEVGEVAEAARQGPCKPSGWGTSTEAPGMRAVTGQWQQVSENLL